MLDKVDIISTVIRRSVEGRPVPTSNTIIMQGGSVDIDLIIDKITADLRDKYLSKTTEDEAIGLINFKPGIKVGGVEFKYDSTNNAVYVQHSDGSPVNFYATGGLSMYGQGKTSVKTIMDAVAANLDPKTLAIENGLLTVIGGTGGGGIESITKQMVIDALGFTPYNASNPNGYITAASIPSALKNPYALTFGSKTYDGSSAKEITASDLGAALSSDLAKYLPLSGGTVSGIVNLNYNLGESSYIRLTNNRTKESSGWAVSMYDFRNHENVSMAGLGAFGGANTLSYLHLGHHEYDGNNLRVYTDKVTFGSNTIWHAGNDGSGSGLDADMLDGKQATSFVWKDTYPNSSDNNYALNTGIYRTTGNTEGLPYKNNGNSVIHCNWNVDAANQLFLRYDGDYIAYRRKAGNVWQPWKQLAFTDSNVASATKLKTARTIWGQSFDGTGDVTGCLHINFKSYNGDYTQGLRINAWDGVSSIFLNTTNASGYDNGMWAITANVNGNLRFRGGATSLNDYMVITQDGNVGIGTTSPAYLLDVNGRIRATILEATERIHAYCIAHNLNDVWSDGTNTHPWYGYDNRYQNTGVYSTTISDYFGMTLRTANLGVFLTQTNMGVGIPKPSKYLHIGGTFGNDYVYANFNTANPYLALKENSNTWYVQGLSNYLCIGSTSSKSLKIDANGNVLVVGGLTMYSQRSLKNVVDERGLSLTELSVIKPTRYTWKDKRDDRIHFGGIADDIEKVLPEVIYRTSEGTLTMDYGNAGFAIASSLIKPVVDHEERIKVLERENKELKEQIKQIKCA